MTTSQAKPKWGRCAAGAAFLVLLVGCSIRPATEDTTQLSSYQISRQISCETRQAVIESTLRFLTSEANRHPFPTNNPAKPFVRLDDHSYAIGLALARHPDSIVRFDPSKLTGNARAIIGLMWNTGIAYNYDLEMTELNGNSAALNFLNAFRTANRTLGLSFRADFERQNTRLFTAATTLGKLVTGPLAVICKPEYIAGENFLYPISGQIGMKKVIFDFLQLALFGNLTGDLSKDFSAAPGPTKLAEQLQFTTTLDFSLTPKVTFTPIPLIGAGFHLADASYTEEAKRIDLHKLTVGLFVPTKGLQAAAQATVLGALVGGPFNGIVSTPVTQSSEEGAVRAVNELLTLKLFQQRTNLFIQ